MTNPPTGRLVPTTTGADLILTRSFRAGLDDVWAGVTEPDRSARWFGRWTGEPGTGNSIKVQMAYEENAPWTEMRIDACEPPTRLALTGADGWRLELVLTAAGDRTELQLIHHLDSTDGLGEVGPGWEYYLDMLVAARDNTPKPTFDDYYPSMKEYFEALRP